MKLNIARQPLVPAFLTLCTLAILVLCRGTVGFPFPAPTGLGVGSMPLLGEFLTQFQVAYPQYSHLVAGFMILFTGMCTGRIATRYNLYTVNTCLPIPLYGIVACGIFIGENYLSGFTASMLLALAIKNYCRSFSNEYGFDAVFRASLYLGLLPLVYAPSIPLLLLMPLAILLFRRTLREAIVAIVGMLLPILALCYAGWGGGDDFIAPFETLTATIFTNNLYFELFVEMPVYALIALALVVILLVGAFFFFLSDRYATGTKSRIILIYIIVILVLILTLLCSSIITPDVFPLLAVPAAILLPVLFVRIDQSIALSIYLLLLVWSVVGVVLQ